MQVMAGMSISTHFLLYKQKQTLAHAEDANNQ